MWCLTVCDPPKRWLVCCDREMYFSKICDCEMYSCDSEMYSCDCDCHICDFLIVMNDVVGKEKERKCE